MSGRSYDGVSVLVTGAQGFIGSWLAERLLDEGARVIVPRREGSGESRFFQAGLDRRCELAEIDLADLPSLIRVLNEGEVEVAFHLAAQTIVAKADQGPLATFEANTRGSYNLLEACRLLSQEGPAPKVVVASSYHVYGKQNGAALSEGSPLRPERPYEVSKACADVIARSFSATYGMPVGVARLANVYGGGDLNFSRLVPEAARALVDGDRPTIRSDGSPERDFLYVEDAVEAYLAIAAGLERPDLRGRAWNAGAGGSVSVEQVVRRLTAASGRDLEPEVEGGGSRHNGIDRQCLDSSMIEHELGWSPKWDLDAGLRETYAWYESHLA